jgi:four helix bundle protein
MNYETELRNKNRGYMKLIVWQKAIELFDLVWATVFTENKIDFKLRSQIADAAQSVSANISEGYGRRSLNEYIQFLYYALGSLAETIDRIAEDPEEYVTTPSLHHSITPALRAHA